MQKGKLKTFGLTAIAFVLPLFVMQASDALLIYPVSGTSSSEKIELSSIQKITFSDNNLNVKPFIDNAVVYDIGNIRKIVFEDIPLGVVNSLAPDLNISITPAGELVVEGITDVKSLTLLSTVGNIIQKTTSSRMNISFLPENIYLLQIDTAKGMVVKKIIKNK